jgi:integrase
MGLHLRGRIWYADYYADGRRVQESTGTANQRKAQMFLALRMSEIERGVYVRRVRVPLSELWERYFAYAQLHKRSWIRDKQMYGKLSQFFGEVNLDSITPSRVEEFQQHRSREVSPATVNRELALLKHMLNLAERWNLRQGQNPVRLVKFLSEDNVQFQTLSGEAEQALLARCPSYLQDMIVFALNTGLRSEDIFNLQWKEVDLETRRLNVLVQKTRRQIVIPLNDAAYEVLAAWLPMRKGPYVFYNQMTGDRFRDLKAGFKLACKQAGLSGVTWHTLRHTFASRLLRKGADIVAVKELLGHSTIVGTMRYAHTSEEAKVRAVQAVGSDMRDRIWPEKSGKNRGMCCSTWT